LATSHFASAQLIDEEAVSRRNLKYGSEYEWAMAHVTLAQGRERLIEAPSAPSEIKWLLADNKKLGSLHQAVEIFMGFRSQTRSVDSEQLNRLAQRGPNRSATAALLILAAFDHQLSIEYGNRWPGETLRSMTKILNEHLIYLRDL
ncbi:MAG: hypothetical protein K2X47_08780, partial [Bdellovibrionales bacterium]|nr:hypothetical protein [Bdellovibrionales bacterium]